MKKYIFAVVIMLFVSQAYSQVADDTPASKPSPSHSPKKKSGATIMQIKAPPSEESVRFYQAIVNGNLDMARLYLSKGADINCDNCSPDNLTPLMKCVTNIESIKFLVGNGANINQQNANGITALMLASASRVWAKEAITLLGDNGADASLKDRNGNDALFYLMHVFGFWQGFRENDNRDQSQLLVRYLLSKGASINQQGKNGITPLMYMASKCNANETKFFLSLGADPSIRTKLGETALSIVEKIAVTSPQGSTCNQTYSILSEPEKYRVAYSDRKMPVNQAGGIQDNKDNKGTQANPLQTLQAIGGFLNGINKILGAPQQQH